MSEWTTTPAPEAEAKTLYDYLSALRRYKWYLILPAVFIVATAAVVAKTLPATYRSTGKILIEQQEIPPQWVPATVTSFADQRIQGITQRVLTTASLTRVIEKLNLYTDKRREMTMEEILERMRASFNIEMIDARVRNPQSGRTGVATIAFSVSFDHHSPAEAQKVANELVSLYLEENAQRRSEAVADTTRFLESEADRLGAELSTMESRIAKFKEKNMGSLPDQQDTNLQLLQRAELALQETRRRIESMEERKVYLESALAQMRSQAGSAGTGDAAAQMSDLDSLRARYARLSGIYSAQHPDVVRLRRTIAALEGSETGSGSADVAAQLRARRQELASIEERYAPDHPDVVRLRNEIAALEQQRAQSSNTGAARGAEDSVSIKTRADLTTIAGDLKSLRQEAREQEKRVRSLEQRIAEAPRAEQAYRKLIRDHENLLAKYRDIRAKQSSARVAESLEQDRKGERFTLIEPPQLPQEPVKPNRWGIMMLGVAGAFVGGFGMVFVREGLDDSVRSGRTLSTITGAPVLAVIPKIETASDRRRRRGRLLLILAVFLLFIAAALLLVHWYYRPLDLLWYELLQQSAEWL